MSFPQHVQGYGGLEPEPATAVAAGQEGQGIGRVNLRQREPYNRLTPAQAERLDWLQEELAEAIQAVAKIKRHGYESRDPTKTGALTNRRDLEIELGQVLRAVQLLGAKEELSQLRIMEAYFMTTGSRYMHHQGDYSDAHPAQS